VTVVSEHRPSRPKPGRRPHSLQAVATVVITPTAAARTHAPACPRTSSARSSSPPSAHRPPTPEVKTASSKTVPLPPAAHHGSMPERACHAHLPRSSTPQSAPYPMPTARRDPSRPAVLHLHRAREKLPPESRAEPPGSCGACSSATDQKSTSAAPTPARSDTASAENPQRPRTASSHSPRPAAAAGRPHTGKTRVPTRCPESSSAASAATARAGTSPSPIRSRPPGAIRDRRTTAGSRTAPPPDPT